MEIRWYKPYSFLLPVSLQQFFTQLWQRAANRQAAIANDANQNAPKRRKSVQGARLSLL